MRSPVSEPYAAGIGERLEGTVEITVGVRKADANGSEPYAPTAHRLGKKK